MPEDKSTRVILIAGPTAGGKSGAAMTLAEKLGGEIVNADAIQVYRELHVLTARPSREDVARVPHHLYGHLSGSERNSAGRWVRAASAVIEDVLNRGLCVIVVGGTGLYFTALVDGLSPVPETPTAIRQIARKRLEKIGLAQFREELLARDPAMDGLNPADTQRHLRAYEVLEATGKPLSFFQSLPREAPLRTLCHHSAVATVVLAPEREQLYAQCDARAAQMLDAGAIDEVNELLAHRYDEDLPIMKALGVPQLRDYLAGTLTLEEALADLQQATRRFAKRQSTWFRNQMTDWPVYTNASDLLEKFK